MKSGEGIVVPGFSGAGTACGLKRSGEAGPRAGGQRPALRLRGGLHEEQGGGGPRRLGEGPPEPRTAARDPGQQRQRQRLHGRGRDAGGAGNLRGGLRGAGPAPRLAADRLHRGHRRAAAGREDRLRPPGACPGPFPEGDHLRRGKRSGRRTRSPSAGCAPSASGGGSSPSGDRQGGRDDRPEHGHPARLRVHRRGLAARGRPAGLAGGGRRLLQPHRGRRRHEHERHGRPVRQRGVRPAAPFREGSRGLRGGAALPAARPGADDRPRRRGGDARRADRGFAARAPPRRPNGAPARWRPPPS